MVMQLNITTLNVKGIDKMFAARRLGDYVRQIRPNIDFLCLQEHKLQGTTMEKKPT